MSLPRTPIHVPSFGFSPVLLNWLVGRDQDINIVNILKTSDLKLRLQLSAHSLTPLIYQKIEESSLAEKVPQTILQWLKNDYCLALKGALLQELEQIKALKKLIRVGVAPILLKGADFHLRLYSNPISRPMCDLDLLISPQELPRAQEVLEGAGYTRAIDSHCFRPGFRKRFMGELHLTSPNGRLMVDLHWYLEAVANFYRLLYGRLAQMAVPWEYEGLPVRLLCPEHAFIHLCLHNYDDLRKALQVVDLGLILTHLTIDWSHLLEEVAFFHCQAPMFLMLDGLQQLFPGTVPETVWMSLRQYRPTFFERIALDPVLGKGFGRLARLHHYHRLSDWAAYLASIFWPHRDYLVKVLGKPDRAAYLWRSFKRL